MLRQLDELLRDVLLANTALATSAQVRFQPPDAQLTSDVQNLNQMVLNVYLVELRENRKLRSNSKRDSLVNGFVHTTWAPERMDCHYLASAWSPAQLAPGIEPTVDEHALLYETATALVLAGQLNPSRFYTPVDPKLALWPQQFRDIDLPTQVLSVEGFGKLSEFWTSMGPGGRWKPVIHLVVTLPLAVVTSVSGPMVTTSLSRFQIDHLPMTAEVFANIGGHVRQPNSDPSGPPLIEVPGAWVRIETMAGVPVGSERTTTEGRFLFDRLRPGQYLLRTGATGLGPVTRVVDVPSETGEYDLQFP